jgi:hypothetical protein
MTFRLQAQILVTAVVTLLVTIGCNLPPTQSIDEALQATRVEELSQFGTNRIDILFVIADSRSIQDEQRRLVDALDEFVEGLDEIGADFHIGFTTPNVAEDVDNNIDTGGGLRDSAGDAFLRNLRPLYQDDGESTVSCTSCGDTCPDAIEMYADNIENQEFNGREVIQRTVNNQTEDVLCPSGTVDDCPEESPEERNIACEERDGTDKCVADMYTSPQESQAYCASEGDGSAGSCYVRGSTCSGPRPELEYCNEPDFDLGKFVEYSDFADPSDPEDELTEDDIEDITSRLRCLAFAGTCNVTASTRPERGLDAIEIALSEQYNSITGNAGFVRDDALLLIVIASDGDDCSVGPEGDERTQLSQCYADDNDPLPPVEDYYEFVTQEVKQEESQVFAAAIVGPAPVNYEYDPEAIGCTSRVPGAFPEADSCAPPPDTQRSGACPPSEIGVGPTVSCATPGDRYSRFVRLFGSRGAFGSVCDGNFTPVLQQLARAVRRNIGLNCVEEQPAECTSDRDCGGDATCVDAPPPLVRIEEEAPDGSVTPIECDTASDCPAAGEGEEEAVCDRGECYRPTFPAATSVRRFCSDFEVDIQVQSPGEDSFESFASPGTVGELDAGDYNEDRDFDLNLYADEQCPQTGVAYRFLRQPSRDAVVRIVYPISISDQALR